MSAGWDDLFARLAPFAGGTLGLDANDGDGIAWSVDSFRRLRADRETIVFLGHAGRFYYPLWQEFWAINNNVLYLTEEMGIRSLGELRRVLNSSLEKEEGYRTEIRFVVVRCRTRPPNAVPMGGLELDVDDLEEVSA